MLIEKLAITSEVLNPSVDRIIRTVGSHLPLSDEEEFRIRLIAKELLQNIVEYSGADRIEMSADLAEGVLTIVIDDNGPGFRYDELMNRDVTQGEYLLDDHGRGIFLVRTMSDGFRYNEAGNWVEVVLKLA